MGTALPSSLFGLDMGTIFEEGRTSCEKSSKKESAYEHRYL